MNRFEAPQKDVLESLYLDKEMNMKEIAEFLGVAIGTVYNYCKKYGITTRNTADVIRGYKRSEETRAKMSRSFKGRKHTEETKKRLSETHKKGGIGHKKKRGDGYIYIYFPDHPKATKDGYIMEHDLIMECLIGRHLYENEVVHHINGIRDDNRKENLKLMTASEHMSYHSKLRHSEKR